MSMTLPLQSLFAISGSKEVSQLEKEQGGCKLNITFVQAGEFLIFLQNHKTKFEYFLNFWMQVTIFDYRSRLYFH